MAVAAVVRAMAVAAAAMVVAAAARSGGGGGEAWAVGRRCASPFLGAPKKDAASFWGAAAPKDAAGRRQPSCSCGCAFRCKRGA